MSWMESYEETVIAASPTLFSTSSFQNHVFLAEGSQGYVRSAMVYGLSQRREYSEVLLPLLVLLEVTRHALYMDD